ncbi:unnamed protein product [Macrosiphum euphorbiae]|uniref:CULT domain-containing protein n=1 Tax=Macrosiphum euphorbiae TaxID=13131 RepID=A0AAV0WY00_9HEMI|nr:unnamed protein product [Macrosiphum euphorbiae]
MNTQDTPNNFNSDGEDNDNPNRQVISNAVVQRRVQDRRVLTIPPALQFEIHLHQCLTASYKYYGAGQDKATAHKVYKEGVLHKLPIIFLKLNLMPGQILPIIARSIHVELILKYSIFRNSSFGVCYKLNINERTFGTIAEVYEHPLEIGTSQPLQMKAIGYQRFEILKVKTFPESHEQSLGVAEIKIIPDITLTYPYNTLCLHPKKRNISHGEMFRKRDIWQTQWPDWVYKQFDVYELASHKDVKISDDPCLLSFQVLYILDIFSQEQVSELLGIESTNLRLQYELQYWNKAQSMQKYLCAQSGCSAPVCNMNNVFPMSPEGPQSTYCNSWGIIHEMITVTKLDDDLDVISVGSPSTECCWFPGYKWTVILCPNCQSHLGWSYLADENLTITPRVFYGLSVRAITSIKD